MKITWDDVKYSDLRMFYNWVISEEISKDISIFELRLE